MEKVYGLASLYLGAGTAAPVALIKKPGTFATVRSSLLPQKKKSFRL